MDAYYYNQAKVKHFLGRYMNFIGSEIFHTIDKT